MAGDKPEKGFFTVIEEPPVCVVHPRVYEKMLKAAGRHIESVDENGVGNCKCSYCEEKRKEEFEETYGD